MELRLSQDWWRLWKCIEMITAPLNYIAHTINHIILYKSYMYKYSYIICKVIAISAHRDIKMFHGIRKKDFCYASSSQNNRIHQITRQFMPRASFKSYLKYLQNKMQWGNGTYRIIPRYHHRDAVIIKNLRLSVPFKIYSNWILIAPSH